MKSKVILFCVLLFCSKIVESTPHSENHFRQRVNHPSNWHVDQTAQDAQYLETDFAQTQNVHPLMNPAIQQDNNEDYYSNQERYNNDGYGFNKNPVVLPSGKQLLGNYNTHIDGHRLESYPHRVDSYPSQIGVNSHQFRNSNWRSQNQYPNSVPSGLLLADSERPLVNTVQEPYRSPVQYTQPKSNRPLIQPDRSFLRREQFQHPLADNAGDGKYITNSAHRFGSSGHIPYENLSEGHAGVSDVKARLKSGQRHLPNLVAQAGNIYNEVPAVIETLADQSENIKYLSPLNNYNDGSPVIPEVEHFSLESEENNAPESYESYNNDQVAASDIKTRLMGSRRNTQSFVPQTGIIYEESPTVVSTDTLEERIDRLRLDLGNTAQITNYDDGSPAIFSADHYSSGSRPNNVRVPYEMYSEAQSGAFEVKPKPIGNRRYIQKIAPQSRQMHNNVPAVIATDILADQSKTIKYEKRGNFQPRSDSIEPVTKQEDGGNINSDSGPSSPTPENNENKDPVDVGKTLSDRPLARKYAHRTKFGSSNIARDDSYNSAPTVVFETVQAKSSSTSTDAESDVPAHASVSSIPSNTNLNPESASGITEFSLINLLSKADIEKIMAGNTKRFLVIHPNKTVEYVDNIDIDSHQNSKLRLVNTKLKHVGDSGGQGTQLPDNVKANPVVETDSNQPIEDQPYVQKADSSSVKPKSPLSNPLTPHQSGGDDTPSEPFNFPENQPEENKKLKPLHSNKRHPVHNYKSKTVHINQPSDNNLNPSTPDENQQAGESNVKTQPLVENQSAGDDNNSNSSSPDENQPSNDETSSSNENQSGDNSNFMPSSPYKRAHHHRSKLSQVNQQTKDSKPSVPDENVPSHIRKSEPSADVNTQTVSSKVADDDSEPLNLHKRKPVRRHKTKKIQLNQPGDVNNANSSSPTEGKPTGDNYKKPLPINEDRSDDDKSSYSYKKQPVDENQPTTYKNSKPQRSNDYETGDENNSTSPSSADDSGSTPSSLDKNLAEDVTKPSPENNTGNDNNSDSLSPVENQPTDDSSAKSSDGKDKKSKLRKRKSEHKKKLKHSHADQSENDDRSLENKLKDDEISKLSFADENQPASGNQQYPQRSNVDQLGEENKSTSSTSGEYQPFDDSSSSSSSKENQNKAVTKPKPSRPSKKKSSVNQKPKSEDEDTSPQNNTGDENNSESLSADRNQPTIDQNSEPQRSNVDQPGHENNLTSSTPGENESVDDSDSNTTSSKENEHKTVTKLIPSHPSKKKSPVNQKPKSEDEDTSPENNTGDENDNDSLSTDQNQPNKDQNSNFQSQNEDQPGYENNSTSSTLGENEPVDDSISSLPSKENQDEAVTKPKPSHPSKKKSSVNQKPKSEDEDTSPENNTGDENHSDLLSTDQNQPGIDQNSKPQRSNVDQPGNENNSTASTPGENEPVDDSDSNKSMSKENQDKAVTKPKSSHSSKKQSVKQKPKSEDEDTSPKDEPGDKNNSKSSSSYQNKPSYDSKLTPAVSKIDSTTESPVTSNYTTLPTSQVSTKHEDKQILEKSTTSSPIFSSTTPSSEKTSEDQIITISPIEQVTDNVSDVTPVTTSTSTAKPIDTPVKSDTNKNKNNEDDNSTNSSSDDLDNNSAKIQTSTTTASPSSATTLVDYTSGDKTGEATVENYDKQTSENTGESQVSKEKEDIQTVQSAVYNSSELLDTNTDGPAESDKYSPVTTSPSVENDVNTGDATGGDTSELEQPETDVTITVSTNTDNDSGDDVITINVEVSETAGSSGKDKTLLINIDTNDDTDDDSDTSSATPTGVEGQSSDLKKDHNDDDDGKGKNLEIDMSNIKGQPTMLIRTANQDFIEKLTDKNDTVFDVIYLFNMVTQPVIEREKETIFHCNGTVSITIKETTYPNKDDPTPNIEKKTQTMHIEDYKRKSSN